MTSFDPLWNEIHKAREWGTYPDNNLIRWVIRNFSVDEACLKTAVDIGCGAGAQTRFLGERGFTVHGIDASGEAIDRCRERAVYYPPRGEVWFEQADITALPFSDGTFDVATDICCIQHILPPDHDRSLAEVHRVLKPGGRFFSMTARENDTTRPDTPMRRVGLDTAFALYRKPGFKIVTMDWAERSDHGGKAFVSHWLVDCQKL